MATANYETGIYTSAGFRSVTITAEVELNHTGKMATVTSVLAIDDEEPNRNMSRTGAKRQQFNGAGVAAREIGKRKRISSCEVLETA